MAEEILNLLAGTRELKVSGRTSSFAFKGKDVSIPEIGRTLGVAHVLEGSVRKSGNRVGVTAQTHALALGLAGRLVEAAEAVEKARTLPDWQALSRLSAELVYFGLGEHARALEVTLGFTEASSLIALERAEEGLGRTRERVEASPTNVAAVAGLLNGLALAGRHEELLRWVAGRWNGPAALEGEIRQNFALGGTLAPVAAAQRATGREAELAATLAQWGETLSFLERHGNASGRFLFHKASYHALSGHGEAALTELARAMDAGYRDPLLDRAPAFEAYREEPVFRQQVARMTELIDADRSRLGLPPLR